MISRAVSVDPTDDNLDLAAERIRAGALVCFPTETVYGLGADATNDVAIAALYEAKGRPRFNPLIIHVADMAQALEIGDFNETALKLAAAFWPGALTLVVPRAAGCPVSLLAGAGLDTIAIRLPGHDVARSLIARAGVPIAAPSANPSGRISPTHAAHVAAELGDKVAMILDGGPCRSGVESTVVQIADDKVVVLRPGAIAREDIEKVAGPTALPMGDEGTPASPGMLSRHYAPDHRLRMNARNVQADEALLAFGPPCPGEPVAALNLSPSGNLKEAAANLFAYLRELDKVDCRAIAVMAIPEDGLGEAINDRLRRAAFR